MSYLKKYLLWPGLFSGIALASSPALADMDRQPEIQAIQQSWASDSLKERLDASESVYLSGITDEAFFSDVEKRLRAAFAIARNGDEDAEEEMLGYAKALASSGNKAFGPVITELAASDPGEMDKDALVDLRNTLHVLADSARWNPALNSSENDAPGQPALVTTVFNMLLSDDLTLVEAGLVKVRKWGSTYPKLYDGVEAMIRKNEKLSYQKKMSSIIAQGCGLLGVSGNTKYRELLTQLAADARGYHGRRVVRHAERALERLEDK